MKNKRVIWFGERLGNEWDKVWQREQELCSWMAEENSVIYVERLPALNRNLRLSLLGVAKRLRRWIKLPSISARIEGLHFVKPLLIPYYFKCLDNVNSLLLKYQIQRHTNKSNNSNFLIWISNPSKFALLTLQALPHPIAVIYQCDNRYDYKSGYDRQALKVEREITLRADLVITPSKTIRYEKLKLNKNTYCIPHSANYALIDFAQEKANLADDSICMKDETKICYFGSFHNIFDFELLCQCADFYRKYEFILWGPITSEAINKLGQRKNIKFAGYLPHGEAARKLCRCDVCVIPYIRNYFSMGVFPHKLFNYLASGRPVVASRLPDLEDFGAWIDLSDDRAEFMRLLAKAADRARDPKYMISRAKEIPGLLRKYSLTINLNKMAELVEQFLASH
jgi:teichuronic acid biosynthesis glycosyltransferase TuaH